MIPEDLASTTARPRVGRRSSDAQQIPAGRTQGTRGTREASLGSWSCNLVLYEILSPALQVFISGPFSRYLHSPWPPKHQELLYEQEASNSFSRSIQNLASILLGVLCLVKSTRCCLPSFQSCYSVA